MKQTRFLLLLLLIFFAIQQSHAQASAKAIDSIKAAYQKINAARNLTKVEIDGEEFMDHATDGGASLTGYISKATGKREVVKMVEKIYLSHTIVQTEYYLSKNALLFVYAKELELSDDGTRIKRTEWEARYYFSNGQLIKKLTTGHPFSVDEATFPGELEAAKEKYRQLILQKSR